MIDAQNSRDIIASIITPPGEGGIGAIRVAGENARDFCNQFIGWQTAPEAFHLSYTRFQSNSDSPPLDEIMAVWMPNGHSYTGDEQVELFTHGGRVVLNQILRALYSAGARPAEPGEFTRRAFLNGRIDLARAEAVAELISAKSDFAYRAARDNLFGRTSDIVDSLREKLVRIIAMLEANVDFPEEDIQPDEYNELLELCDATGNTLHMLVQSYAGGAIIRDGFRIALCGAPNAGKSSLFNALVKKRRAIVSETPGTTRDYLSEWISLDGYAIELSDTAGLREDADEIEREGISFSHELINRAHLALWVADTAQQTFLDQLNTAPFINFKCPTIIVFNKIDSLTTGRAPIPLDTLTINDRPYRSISISCKTGQGISDLERAISEMLNTSAGSTDEYIVTSERHMRKFADAASALQLTHHGLTEHKSPELVAFDARQALTALDEITGRVYTDEVLDVIFSSFCVGK